jgi:ribosomal protein L11 methyltransferase
MAKEHDNKNKTRLKITIMTDPALVDPISDFLMGVTDVGVEIGVDDQAALQTLNVYLAEADLDPVEKDRLLGGITSYLHEISTLFQVDLPVMTISDYVEEDWGSTWKKHFVPFAIVPGLIIAPTWEQYVAAPGETVIVMDPGMAFGTGHHATTSLSLSLVREVVQGSGGLRVLDVGTGTGILGMAAALYGAAEVLGIDNDPEAVAAAEANVRLNGLAGTMQVAATPLESLTGDYSLVIANIIHDTLLAMAPVLDRLTRPAGALVLSGILQGPQTENIIDCFEQRGFRLKKCEQLTEWSALLMIKEGT